MVQDVVYQITALGQIEARDLVQVTAQVDGVATEFASAKATAWARAPCCCGSTPTLPARGRASGGRLDQSRAEQERAGADPRRREALAQNDLLSTEELNRSRSDAKGLSASAEAAKAARGIAVQNLQRAEVRPQASGVIDTRPVDTGQFVRAATALATIVDSSRLRLRFKLSEAESLRANLGPASPSGSPLSAPPIHRQIYHVGRIADTTTRQVEVLAWVENLGELKPGFFAEVSLGGEERKIALVIPEGAIQASERGFWPTSWRMARRGCGDPAGPSDRHGVVEILRACRRARPWCTRAPTASPTASRSRPEGERGDGRQAARPPRRRRGRRRGGP